MRKIKNELIGTKFNMFIKSLNFWERSLLYFWFSILLLDLEISNGIKIQFQLSFLPMRTNFNVSIIIEWKALLIQISTGVGYFKEGEDQVNTYQVVIITDGVETYLEFLYPENGLQWIQGTGDKSGLPDARAQAGIISPDGKLFTLPGSGTEKVRNLDRWVLLFFSWKESPKHFRFE